MAATSPARKNCWGETKRAKKMRQLGTVFRSQRNLYRSAQTGRVKRRARFLQFIRSKGGINGCRPFLHLTVGDSFLFPNICKKQTARKQYGGKPSTHPDPSRLKRPIRHLHQKAFRRLQAVMSFIMHLQYTIPARHTKPRMVSPRCAAHRPARHIRGIFFAVSRRATAHSD